MVGGGGIFDNTPPVLELFTPESSFEFPVGLASNLYLFSATYHFINYCEFASYHFIYVLSLYVTFALVIGPNCGGSDNVVGGAGGQDSPHSLLQALRLKNVDRIIIGHLNINSIRNKIGLLGDMVRESVDILVVSETKIDGSFPPAQFCLGGYADPHRLDRTAGGGDYSSTFAMISLQGPCQ